MVHPLVDQLRFARSEWRRALDGVSDEDARRRLLPMNSISWIVGHLAWQENRYWLRFAQGKDVAPQLNALVGYGKPPSTPPLEEMWSTWQTVTGAADAYLDSLTDQELGSYYQRRGKDIAESIGTLLQRVIYHYWYHTGEAMAIRQMLGHLDLPEFVGTFSDHAHFRPR
jgi:uncharacterized damage-inducible protein DinB